MKKHIVAKGESLWVISQKYYGVGMFWRTIYAENINTIGLNPDLIEEGITVLVPAKPYSHGKSLKQEIDYMKSIVNSKAELTKEDKNLIASIYRLENEFITWRMVRLLSILGAVVSVFVIVKVACFIKGML